jgi:regulator of extracellular matrix RemA (YlzA/DUF370 family)
MEGKGKAFLNIGFGNVVFTSKIIAILSPDSAPMRRLRETAKETGSLLDATQGRKTRSIIVMNTGQIVLSAMQVETLVQRFDTKLKMEKE